LEEFERLVGTGRCTQTTLMPSLANSSPKALLLQDHRDRIVGRPVDANSFSASAANAAPGSSVETAMSAAKAGARKCGHVGLPSEDALASKKALVYFN